MMNGIFCMEPPKVIFFLLEILKYVVENRLKIDQSEPEE